MGATDDGGEPPPCKDINVYLWGLVSGVQTIQLLLSISTSHKLES